MATKTVTVLPGERLDNLAYRVLGDPERYGEILALNPDLDIFAPQAGQTVEVPDA